MLLLLLSRRGARDRKVEATKNDDCRRTTIARSLRCASFELRFDTERGPRAGKAEQVSERNSTTKLYNVSRLYRFSKCSRSRALLCSLSRSPLIGDLCERRSTHRAHCCLGLSVHYRAFHFHFQFVWKNSFTLCCCSSATAACVCKYCLADDFWLIELTLLCLRAYRAVTENSRSRWRKQHARRADEPTIDGGAEAQINRKSHMPKGCTRSNCERERLGGWERKWSEIRGEEERRVEGTNKRQCAGSDEFPSLFRVFTKKSIYYKKFSLFSDYSIYIILSQI